MSPDNGESRLPAWQRPPFEPGNTAALKYGAHSPRVYGPIAEELVAVTVAQRPDLVPFPQAVASWATAEACAELARKQVAEVGMYDENGEPREGLQRSLVLFERHADVMRRRLGLDPVASAELARQQVEAARSKVDLEGLRERGAQYVEATTVEDDSDEEGT